IELLTQGVARHPNFTIARVVLTRELYNKGLILQAWRILEESPVNLFENALAQRLKFKLALLLTDEINARQTLTNLKRGDQIDSEMKRYGEIFDVQGLLAARDTLKRDLKNLGIEMIVPEEMPPAKAPQPAPPQQEFKNEFLFEKDYSSQS